MEEGEAVWVAEQNRANQNGSAEREEKREPAHGSKGKDGLGWVVELDLRNGPLLLFSSFASS